MYALSNSVKHDHKPLLSIVICFRDWGLDRLAVAIRAHFVCSADISIEVVVSDYGSKDAEGVRSAVVALGARIVRTETKGQWSRSAALNAGIFASRGKYIITTDADIVFSPHCYRLCVERLESNPRALYLIQCRDLPKDYGASEIAEILADGAEDAETWRQLDRASTIRPRWGMGGFAAFGREIFSEINGYEERMAVWGGEDNDFAVRFRRAGYPLRWLSSGASRIYHIWHPPSQMRAIESDEGKEAVERNRKILRTDKSIVRNLQKSFRVRGSSPCVSVIIPTYRRGELLRVCLESCRAQTFRNYEVIVVENGDSIEGRAVVESINDPRYRYIKIERNGASVARNVGLDASRGRYVVIHDDDDIMISTRIEDHLSALTESFSGTYSGWIDFENDSYEVIGRHPGKEFGFEALLCNGKVLTHGSLMLDRMIFRMFRYEEDVAAGIDYGFLLRLARNGLRLRHTGKYGILRRMHSNNLTRVDSHEQKTSAIRMIEEVKRHINDEEYKTIRKIGLGAASLECENETEAIAELQRYRSHVFQQSDQYKEDLYNLSDLACVDEFIKKLWEGREEPASKLKTLSVGMRSLINSRARLLKLRNARHGATAKQYV